MIENHVTSLELSKRLKELGVPQNSLFYWADNYLVTRTSSGTNNYWPDQDNSEVYSAFLASELGEMLPDNCYTQKDCGTLPIEWLCHQQNDENQENVFIEDTECNAKAQMLIHLIENNIIKAEDLK